MNPRTLVLAILLAFLLWLLLLWSITDQGLGHAEMQVPRSKLEITVPELKSATPEPVTSTTSSSMARAHETAPMQAIRDAFARFGAPVVAQAVRVAGCESTGDPSGQRLNPAAVNGPHSGLFQVSRLYHAARVVRLGFTWAQMLDPNVNATVAADIYAESGWQPWSCRWAA